LFLAESLKRIARQHLPIGGETVSKIP
jgi:hypothetical protein